LAKGIDCHLEHFTEGIEPLETFARWLPHLPINETTLCKPQENPMAKIYIQEETDSFKTIRTSYPTYA
jgi:hypothetical protein